jgi:arylsulfatase A-like enzyme
VSIVGLAVVLQGTARGQADQAPDRRGAADASELPNVIFVWTDDQDLASFRRRFMPRTFRSFVKKGTLFNNFVVSTPLCCPSRVTSLTGSYPHNSDIYSNKNAWSIIADRRQMLHSWMHRAGYKTAWVGKFLQGYEKGAVDKAQPPKGIDEWHASFEPRYYDYSLARNGMMRDYGSDPKDHLTTVLSRIATNQIEKASRGKRPLFMVLNHLTPHKARGPESCVPSPGHKDLFAGAPVPKDPSFNEADIEDKPEFIRQDLLSDDLIENIEERTRCRWASLAGVDKGMADIRNALRKTGELQNSVVIFSSDNGILSGQHRLARKSLPYEEGIRQPLAIWAGSEVLNGGQVAEVDQLTANVDIASTILDFAQAEPCVEEGRCRPQDGSSLKPLMKGNGGEIRPDREILIEGKSLKNACRFHGLRTPGLSYMEHQTGGDCKGPPEVEFYDLAGELTGSPDPFQLDNLASPVVPASDDPQVLARRAQLAARLVQLRQCDGEACH